MTLSNFQQQQQQKTTEKVKQSEVNTIEMNSHIVKPKAELVQLRLQKGL